MIIKPKIDIQMSLITEYNLTDEYTGDSFSNFESFIPSPGILRFPPRMIVPMMSMMSSNQLTKKFLHDNISIFSKMQDAHETYQRYAKALFDTDSLIPSGHPLFSSINSTGALKAENDKLRKENLKLKNQSVKPYKNKPLPRF